MQNNRETELYFLVERHKDHIFPRIFFFSLFLFFSNTLAHILL